MFRFSVVWSCQIVWHTKTQKTNLSPSLLVIPFKYLGACVILWGGGTFVGCINGPCSNRYLSLHFTKSFLENSTRWAVPLYQEYWEPHTSSRIPTLFHTHLTKTSIGDPFAMVLPSEWEKSGKGQCRIICLCYWWRDGWWLRSFEIIHNLHHVLHIFRHLRWYPPTRRRTDAPKAERWLHPTLRNRTPCHRSKSRSTWLLCYLLKLKRNEWLTVWDLNLSALRLCGRSNEVSEWNGKE